MNNSERRHAHEEAKRTRKLRRLAERLGITVRNASNSLLQAREALNEHPDLQARLDAYRRRN